MSDIREPTIAAIATPPGAGGIGIIRISGPNSLGVLTRLFQPKTSVTKLSSHRLYYGWIISPDNHKTVDEVLVTYMAAPHTYTREDVVEIHCHGSYIILQNILKLVNQSGARAAEPGEFTKRAFLNGRIDLTQAEAVIELLNAKTDKGLEIAVNQLQGNLHNEIQQVRDTLLSIKAIIEVAIDFPEDDVDILDPQRQKLNISNQAVPPLENLINAADQGQIYREGISVVIIGRPNVGKSSLLNALLKKDRAIVTEVPGTTRDTIEEYINIEGMPVKIIDTAGIRDGVSSVEQIGIERSREKLAQADLVLLMVDSSVALQQEDFALYKNMPAKQMLVVANKKDLSGAKTVQEYFPGQKVINISAKTGAGIKDLEESIFSLVTGDSSGWDPGQSSIPNVRHQSSLKNSLAACHSIISGLDNNLPADLLAIELQTALDYLGDIIGYTTTEDVLDKIFAEFCIGK